MDLDAPQLLRAATSRRSYVFGSLAAQAARIIIWLLPEVQELNQHGVARMCRMLAVLQPALSALGASGGFRPEAARSFDKRPQLGFSQQHQILLQARSYFNLLMLSPQALIRAAAERPGRYTPTEWAALLQVVMQDRPVTNEDKILLAKTVGLPLPATKNPLQMAAKQMAAMLK
eukprot:jgi/Astpho2/1516/Aster-x0064